MVGGDEGESEIEKDTKAVVVVCMEVVGLRFLIRM
jgi:hypothetical protein